MKNLFVILFAILPIVATAQTMCVRDNSLVISLDGNINPSSQGGTNVAESIWWVDFPYGRIYGEGTILSETEGLGQTTFGAYYGTGEYTNTLITAEPGLSGLDANGNERTYCWCRLTHPATSAWVLLSPNPSTQCVRWCHGYIVGNFGSQYRKYIFNAIGM